MAKFRVLISGGGGAGVSVANSMHQDGRGSAVAFFDPIASQREKLAAEFPDAQLSDDYHALLKKTQPDAVVVAGPDHLHTEQGVLALEHGAHVLIEKPMTTTVADAHKLIEAERNSGKQIMVDFTMRYSHPTSTLAKMARNGEFGRLICVGGNYIHDMWHYYNPEGGTWYTPWRVDKKNPQNILLGGGCHGLDLMLWVMEGNPVQEVFCFSTDISESGFPIEDTYVVSMRFGDGALGKLFVTTGACGAAGPMFELYGTEGSSIDGLLMRRNETPAPLPTPEDDGGGHGWPASVRDFLNFLSGDIENPVPSRFGAQNVAICEAAFTSMRTGKPVKPEQF